jgi:Tat protein secretion system quality control protein TatD with DNase activity
MGKSRKGRRRASQNEEEESEEDTKEPTTSGTSTQPSRSFKDLDFTERRALQRQQAAEKRRAKQKCYLCGQSGHVRRECPGIPDDGRGMSRYKGKSDKAAEKQKLMERRKKRTSGSGGTSGNYEQTIAELWPDYPEAFQVSVSGTESLVYYDVHCDINASITYLRQGRGMAKISYKAATEEYRAALFMSTGLQAMLCRTVLMKPGRPWTNPLPADLRQNDGEDDDDDDDACRVCFVLGLAPTFTLGDAAMKNEAIESLITTVNSHATTILGIEACLDYSHEAVQRPGMDEESQVYRLQVAWEAAGRLEIPLQLQLLPGAASLDPEGSIAGSEYAKVLLTAQEQLSNAVTAFPNLAIHVVGWCGKANHMIALLQTFPHNIQGIGVDGTVTFAKAKDVHECAFDVPLDRLLIETASVIPSQVNNRLGRSAFFHSGFWPFVAQAIADHKKTVLVRQVVQAVNENALRLYPGLCLNNNETMEKVDASNKEDGIKSTETPPLEFS